MHSSRFGDKWMDSRVNHELTSLLIHEVSKIVSPTTSSPASLPSTWSTMRTVTERTIPSLHDFIQLLVRRSHTRTGTLLVALILLTRLSYRLGHVMKGRESSPQRIFLASLIVSTKLIHDTSPKNKHWLAFCDNYFQLAEINLMEKQFLTLMDFNLSISDYDFQQVLDRYRYKGRDKKRGWQETPECMISPSQNVALSLDKDTIVTKRPLPSLSPSPTLSTPSISSPSTLPNSPLLVLSLSSTPVFNVNSSSADAYSVTLEANPSTKDDSDDILFDRCYFSSGLSPLSSA